MLQRYNPKFGLMKAESLELIQSYNVHLLKNICIYKLKSHKRELNLPCEIHKVEKFTFWSCHYSKKVSFNFYFTLVFLHLIDCFEFQMFSDLNQLDFY